MKIGELATLTGVSVRMLRYYEAQGLLNSTRTATGQRTYVPEDTDRVDCLRMLFGAGLSSRTIAEILPCADRPSLETSEDAHAVMSRERDRLDDTIGHLTRAREALDGLLAANRVHREQLLEGELSCAV